MKPRTPCRSKRSQQPATAIPPPDNAQPDPRLIPFLDVLAELIARHILAEQAIGAGEQLPPSSPPLEPAPSVETPPGQAGPIPTVPAQSHGQSHGNPKPAARRTAGGNNEETP